MRWAAGLATIRSARLFGGAAANSAGVETCGYWPSGATVRPGTGVSSTRSTMASISARAGSGAAICAAMIVGSLGGLLSSGCAALPASQARMRQQVQSEMRPAPIYEQLLAFHAALLQTPGVELEHVAILTRWIALGVRTVRGDHPEQWEEVARPGWPQVRSLIGPYDTLQPFAAVFDSLLQ